MKKALLLFILVILFANFGYGQFTANFQNVRCNDSCNGYANIAPQGNYQYLWDDGRTTLADSNLCAGPHFCMVYDSVGNPLDTVLFTINQPAPISINTYVINSSCFGLDNGQINISVSGGTSSYIFNWSDGSLGGDLTNLAPGTYGLTVTDQNGCTSSVFATVLQPAQLSVSGLDTTVYTACNGVYNGNLYPVVTGGTTPYSYTWSNGVSTGLTGEGTGLYYLTITDANGCTIFGADTILSRASFLNVTTGVTYLPSCNGTVSAFVQGGTPPFHYVWSNNASIDSFNANLTVGAYWVTVTDSTGCSVVNYAFVGPMIDSTQITRPTCDHPNSGSITADVLGVSGQIFYQWNNGATTATISNLTPGNYSLTVTDMALCTSTHVFNLPSNTNFGYYAYVSTSSANCNNNGSALVTPNNGYPPYSYQWNTIPVQTGAEATGLSAGSYQVTITDSLGCVYSGNAVINYACNNILTGTIFMDSNSNCILDTAETGYANFIISALNSSGQTLYAYSNTTGVYSFVLPDTGTYTISTDNYYGFGGCANILICNNNRVVTFNGTVDTISNVNFGIVPGTGFDLALHPGWTSANPGFEKDYWIYYYNQSPAPYSGNATISFQYDSNLTFLYSDTQYTTYTSATHTLTWDVNSVSTGWNRIGMIRFGVPATLALNYQLQSDFKIEPFAGDCDPGNNEMHFSEIVTGSHDPNEKTVEPAANISPDDSILTYTIHFQNTGTASTVFIIVKDTLSPYLDPATVRNLASSLKYSSFNIGGQGILTWIFNPGTLPDSITDASGSKGFITFSVKKKNSTSINSVISNSASIYFDYNSPVMTNTVTDTVANPLFIVPVNAMAEVLVTAFPNPFSDATTIIVSGVNQPYMFEIYDLSGRLQKQVSMANNSPIELLRNQLASGMYLYSISLNGKQAAYGKLIAE